MPENVDEFYLDAKLWPEELKALRQILLETPLTEEFKWRSPCYTFGGKNVAIATELKKGCTLSFFNGSLLKDSQGVLEKPGENSRTARIITFTSVEEVLQRGSLIKKYVNEAIQLEKEGARVDSPKAEEFPVPVEFQQRLENDPVLKEAFEALTPGRQRGYLIFFSSAKQSKTRGARIEKYTDRIISGKGMNDCVCGLSNRMPGCDGSHNSHQSDKGAG